MTEQVLNHSTRLHDEIQSFTIAERQRARIVHHPLAKLVQSLLLDPGRPDQPSRIRLWLNSIAWKKPNLVESKEDLILGVGPLQERGRQQQSLAQRLHLASHGAKLRALLRQTRRLQVAVETG